MSQSTTGSDSIIERLGASTIARSERIHFKSVIVGRVYRIDVALPPQADRPIHSLPVIYVLDGNTLFGLTCQTARLLEVESNCIPPSIVVGIGYPVDDSADGSTRRRALRIRDYTPSEDNSYLQRTRSGLEPFSPSSDLGTGGANAFLGFIRDELKPFIESEFDADPQDHTVIGMSLGGLVALHGLFTTPSLFARWLAISPAVWWDQRVLLKTEASFSSQPLKMSVRLFIGVGGSEDIETLLDVRELVQQIRSRCHRGLELTYIELPDETHQSVFPGSLTRGLRAVFAATAGP